MNSDNSTLVDKLMDKLSLEPLPGEGGYYAETYRSEIALSSEDLGGTYPGKRNLSTAIYYLLTPETHSALHKLPGDELYHFYLGDPVELLKLRPDGSSEVVILGQKVLDGMKVQELVPGGTVQGARIVEGGKFALLGTTMAPGFEFEDFEAGDPEQLAERYPEHAGLIRELG